MCGIFGAVEWEQPLEVGRLIRATDSLQHRGPDESGFLFDNVERIPTDGRLSRFLGVAQHRGQVGLGHRRLSILDLTSGQQPMTDATGRWSIIFNGEIYNHMELRKVLAAENITFLTDHSD